MASLGRRSAAALGLLVAIVAAAASSAQGRAPGVADFSGLYERQSPAVVSIDITQKLRVPRFPGFGEGDPFHEFFRRFGQAPLPFGGPDREFSRQSIGSGFIIGADGHLLTNAHVVADADEVSVNLADGREFTAKVIGTDRRTDVALLKIDATGLPTVTIGDPARLRVGEWVVAIGKPFGLEHTMTAGIVSATGRDLSAENLVPYIQTDVAINPGSSGGPLFNLDGEVVGVNSLIFSRSGGYMGLAFAIPIDVAMDAAKQLRENGHVIRGRIGVGVQPVTPEIAEAFGLQPATGVLVGFVEKGGPADHAGMKAGDIALSVDGREVRMLRDLPRMIAATRPDTRVTLRIWREGGERDVVVTVARLDDEAMRPRQRRSGTPHPRVRRGSRRRGPRAGRRRAPTTHARP